MIVKVKNVNKLRELTGAGIYDCKIALSKCNDNVDVAYYYLRLKGDCVSRRKNVNGILVAWTDEDYIEKAKEMAK